MKPAAIYLLLFVLTVCAVCRCTDGVRNSGNQLRVARTRRLDEAGE